LELACIDKAPQGFQQDLEEQSGEAWRLSRSRRDIARRIG
jgi:hypothetical protein